MTTNLLKEKKMSKHDKLYIEKFQPTGEEDIGASQGLVLESLPRTNRAPDKKGEIVGYDFSDSE